MKRLQGYRLVTLAYSFNAVFLVIGSMAFAQTPITSSGLNTQVSGPIAVGGQTQFNITGGTRPGGGTNLFHSFGNFNVPNNNVANFLNNTGLPTTNILGRVTGGNVSNILGTIQTTGFGNANLFLMNPAGFLFGPNATVNVGGMVAFTSADYLRLADGAKFNAKPNATADALLSTAPVAAFGFLGSNPGAITVQGSQLSVADNTGISLVGGNITAQAGTLTAPSGDINLISVGKPSNGGGEVIVNNPGSGLTLIGFKSQGGITLSQGSIVDTSAAASDSGQPTGNVFIRAGQFFMDGSVIKANPAIQFDGPAGNVDVTAQQVALSNGSIIDTSFTSSFNIFRFPSSSNVTFNVKTFSATDSTITTSVKIGGHADSGAITIQGISGTGDRADSVSLTNSTLVTSNFSTTSGGVAAGPITIVANDIALNHAEVISFSLDGAAGTINLSSTDGINIQDSALNAGSDLGGAIHLTAGGRINLSNTNFNATSSVVGGTITASAPLLQITGGLLNVSGGGVNGGNINLTTTGALILNGTQLLANGNSFRGAGNITLNGGRLFTSQQSTISATSTGSNGGTIHIDANRVGLTDTQVTTSVSGGPQTVGGTITIDAKNTTLRNSEILSTATEGHGGTITINSKVLHQNPSTVIDASSQTGPDGTVTVNGVIQP